MVPYTLIVSLLFISGAITHPLEQDQEPQKFDDVIETNDAVPVIPEGFDRMTFVPKGVVEGRAKDSDDEDMDTASSIVFRPLFAYRKQVAQRRRVYNNRQKKNNNRRQSNRPSESYPYGYPAYGYPYYMDREFPHVP